MPDEVLQAMGLGTVEVERLVNEYLENQTLKILPQAPFGDAVTQFVSKQDKHAMEEFVKDSLSSQMKQMMSLGDDEDGDEDENLDSVMEQCKKRLEDQFKAGLVKQSRRRYKPKPSNWDSDMDGHWLDQEDAVLYEPEAAAPPQPTHFGSRGSTPVASDEDEEMEDAEPEEVVPKKRGRPKAAAAKPGPAKKTPAKKAPAKKEAAKKAPAKGRGRKTGPFLEDSDEEDDVFLDEDDDVEEAAAPPKRAAATRSQSSRPQPTRGAPMTQTKLNFSQKGSQNQPLEVSDDMISDDEDDPFEPMPAKNTGRRR